MIKKISYITTLGLFLLIFSACSDSANGLVDTSEVSTTTLTESQANAVVEQIGQGFGALFEDGESMKLSTRATTMDLPGNPYPCDEDTGEVTITGSLDVTATGSTVSGSYDVSEEYDGCKVQTKDILLTGSIDKVGNLDVDISSGFDGTISATTNGLLAVSGADVTAGNCGVSIAYSGSGSGTAIISITVTGSICGRDINHTYNEDTSSE